MGTLSHKVAGRLRSFFSLRPALEHPGAGVTGTWVRHYVREDGGGRARVHLRIDPGGDGLLLVNASRAFHLNPSAAFMAYLALEQVGVEEAVRAIRGEYHVAKAQAQADYGAFVEQMDGMTHPDEHCPVCELDLETTAPFSHRPSAPYRMDLALTYRCNNNCAHCYNARSRQHPELSTGDWKLILDRCWEAGIPHIVFTGGEPTLRPDLPELIAYAEGLGQITGINTNGRALADRAFVDALVTAGLDHAQITLESHDAAIHNSMVKNNRAWDETVAGIKNVVATRLYMMTNTTLLSLNAPGLKETLAFLGDLGVPTVGLNALIYSGHGVDVGTGLPESALPPLLTLAREETARRDQKLIWYTPTQYCHFDPVQLELGVKGCSAALYNMCVEPDGSVLPCQSYYEPMGNMLSDPFERIWNHDLAVSLRERLNAPEGCRGCALLAECGGGCPLSRKANPDVPVHAILEER